MEDAIGSTVCAPQLPQYCACVTSRYTPPPSRAQRWLVARRRIIHAVYGVYVVSALAFLIVSVMSGQATISTWISACVALIVAGSVVVLLLPGLRRYVERWDSTHPPDPR